MSHQRPLAGDPVSRSARAAARRLAPDLGPELEPQVEAALHDRSTNQYADPVSIGSLIVSTAALTWTIFKDLRNKEPKPQPKTIIEQVRIELPADDQIAPADLDKIIQVIVDEMSDNTDN